MKRFSSISMALIVAAALIFPVVAFSQVVPPTPDDPGAFLQAILAAFTGKNWAVFGALLTVGIVWGLRKFGANVPKVGAFLNTSRGGAVLSLAVGLSTQFAIMAMTGGSVFSVQTLINGLLAAIAASGGWVIIRRIVFGDVGGQVSDQTKTDYKPADPPPSASDADKVLNG